MMIFAISVTVAGLIPVICFAQAHPSDDQLKSLFGAVAPQIFDIQSLTIRYSSMKEMSGTTLPDGSLQAICKVVAKLKQDLYVTAGQADSNNADAKLIIDLERRKRPECRPMD